MAACTGLPRAPQAAPKPAQTACLIPPSLPPPPRLRSCCCCPNRISLSELRSSETVQKHHILSLEEENRGLSGSVRGGAGGRRPYVFCHHESWESRKLLTRPPVKPPASEASTTANGHCKASCPLPALSHSHTRHPSFSHGRRGGRDSRLGTGRPRSEAPPSQALRQSQPWPLHLHRVAEGEERRPMPATWGLHCCGRHGPNRGNSQKLTAAKQPPSSQQIKGKCSTQLPWTYGISIML